MFFQILQTNIYLVYSFSDKNKIFVFTTDEITGLGHKIITTYRSYSYNKHVIAAVLHWSRWGNKKHINGADEKYVIGRI